VAPILAAREVRIELQVIVSLGIDGSVGDKIQSRPKLVGSHKNLSLGIFVLIDRIQYR
jgi:hypothetical protein